MKYYDQAHPTYGEDHNQIEMNPSDLFYRKPGYYEVHFRIDTKGYDYRNGFVNSVDKEAFYNEVRFFQNVFGIETNSGYDPKGPEYLYYHPQDISGVLHSSKIMAWAYLMEEGFRTFKCRCIDVYEYVWDIPEVLYIAYLNEHRAEITAYILESFKTKRSNLYIASNGVWGNPYRSAEKKFGLNRCAYLRHRNVNFDSVFANFYSDLMTELLSVGKIATAETKNGKGYRTVTVAQKRATRKEV